MKTTIKIAILATCLSTAFPFINAAEPSGPMPSIDSATGAGNENHARVHAPPHHRRVIARRIIRKLNLNESQVAQLKTIRGSTHTTLKTIRANTSLTPGQKKEQIRDALKASREQMRAALTPEQQVQLDEMKTRAWERRGGF